MAEEIEEINKSLDQTFSSEEESNSTSPSSSAKSIPLIGTSVIGGCCVCGLDNNHETLLLCDICDGPYHLACLHPPMDSVPEGDWICSE